MCRKNHLGNPRDEYSKPLERDVGCRSFIFDLKRPAQIGSSKNFIEPEFVLIQYVKLYVGYDYNILKLVL